MHSHRLFPKPEYRPELIKKLQNDPRRTKLIAEAHDRQQHLQTLFDNLNSDINTCRDLFNNNESSEVLEFFKQTVTELKAEILRQRAYLNVNNCSVDNDNNDTSHSTAKELSDLRDKYVSTMEDIYVALSHFSLNHNLYLSLRELYTQAVDLLGQAVMDRLQHERANEHTSNYYGYGRFR